VWGTTIGATRRSKLCAENVIGSLARDDEGQTYWIRTCGCREPSSPSSWTGFSVAWRSWRRWVVALSFLYVAFVRLLQLVRLSWAEGADLAIEVVMLRHEVSVLRRQVSRPALRPPDRAVLAGLSRVLSSVRRGSFFVQPETLLRWHRDLVRRRWNYPRRVGRPALPVGTVHLVLRLATENPRGDTAHPWGTGHHWYPARP
jgi:hypothetical protein